MDAMDEQMTTNTILSAPAGPCFWVSKQRWAMFAFEVPGANLICSIRSQGYWSGWIRRAWFFDNATQEFKTSIFNVTDRKYPWVWHEFHSSSSAHVFMRNYISNQKMLADAPRPTVFYMLYTRYYRPHAVLPVEDMEQAEFDVETGTDTEFEVVSVQSQCSWPEQ